MTPVGIVVAGLVAIWFGATAQPYLLRELSLIIILGMVASGLNVTYGVGGQLVLAHAAMYGAGAYTAGILAMHGYSLPVMLVGATIVGAFAGLAVGLPGLRIGGWPLALVTFFAVLLLPELVNLWPEETGGFSGLGPIMHGWSDTELFYVTAACLLGLLVLTRNLITSPWGDLLRVLRHSGNLVESSGCSVVRVKVVAYAVGAIPAGLAGGLLAAQEVFINTSMFTTTVTIGILAAVIIGGQGSTLGPLLGAAAVYLVPREVAQFDQYAEIIFGAVLILAAIAMPEGIVGGLRAGGRLLRQRLRPNRGSVRQAPRLEGSDQEREAASTSDSDAAGSSLEATNGRRVQDPDAPALEVVGLSKSFGGLRALADVDLVAHHGEVTGIIGPNGSGKTTFVNAVSGYIDAEAGRVQVSGRNLVGSPPSTRVRAGVGRTFQTPQIPRGISVRSAVAMGRFWRSRWGVVESMLRLPSWRRKKREMDRACGRILRDVALDSRWEEVASELGLGEKRLLEVARAASSEPAVLLLDEPAAGLSQAEIDELVAFLMMLRERRVAIVVIEHNVELVARIADRMYCLAEGRVIAAGSPRDVVDDPNVRVEYLGHDDSPRTPGVDDGVTTS